MSQPEVADILNAGPAAARTIEQLTGEELRTMNAAELIDALGGIAQGEIRQDGFYTREFAELVKAQPMMPLMIATPETWRAPFPYSVEMQANGMTMKVQGDKLTLVPQVFYEIWMNHISGEAELRRARAAGQRNLNMSKAEMPTWGVDI